MSYNYIDILVDLIPSVRVMEIGLLGGSKLTKMSPKDDAFGAMQRILPRML